MIPVEFYNLPGPRFVFSFPFLSVINSFKVFSTFNRVDSLLLLLIFNFKRFSDVSSSLTNGKEKKKLLKGKKEEKREMGKTLPFFEAINLFDHRN